MTREQHVLLAVHRDQHQARGGGQGGLHGVGQAVLQPALDHQAVHHHLDGVLLVAVQLDLLAKIAHLAVHADPNETLTRGLFQLPFVDPLTPAHDRGHDLDLRALGQLEHGVHDLLYRLRGDGPAAAVTVRSAGPGEQQPQVVVDLGHRAHRGARVPERRLLLDGDRRGQALDGLDVRLLHLLQELPRVGRQ